MPRVTPESHSVPPSRPARSEPDANAKPSASPFNEMLDSAAASSEAGAVSAARKVRTERTERAEKPKPTETKSADGRGADTKPVQDAGNGAAKTKIAPTEGKAATIASDVNANTTSSAGPMAITTVIATPSTDATAITSTKADKAAASGDADRNPDATADQLATSDPATADAGASAVTAPQPLAIAAVIAVLPASVPGDAGTGASSPGDTLAILPTAGQAPRGLANVAPKLATPQPRPPSQPSDSAQDDAPTDTASPADPTAAAPKVDPAKSVEQQGQNDKAVGELHRAAVDRIAKPGTHAPAANQGDPAANVSADPAQNTGLLATTHAADAPAVSSAPALAQAQPPAAVAVPLAGLAIEIATQAHDGKNHFEIRLDPPELGRIDVKLDVDRDGNVSTRLVVDRSDTLDLLKRDASSLERALQQAGLKTSDQGLDFSLRQHAFAERDASAQAGTRLIVPDDDPAPLKALLQGYGRRLGLGGGLDIRV